MIYDMIQTREGTYVPVLARQMVRTQDGSIGLHMTLQFDHDAIEMRDGSGMVWVKKQDSNRGSPLIETENTEEE